MTNKLQARIAADESIAVVAQANGHMVAIDLGSLAFLSLYCMASAPAIAIAIATGLEWQLSCGVPKRYNHVLPNT